METCQSGLTYLFAKEAGALYPLEGSNPSVSAKSNRPVAVLILRETSDILNVCHMRDSKAGASPMSADMGARRGREIL